MGFTSRKLVKTESQPIYIPAGFTGGQVYFPDNQYIRNKKLMAMEVTPDLNSLFGLAPMQYVDGTELAGRQLIQNSYLTLESYTGVQYVRKKCVISLEPYLEQGIGNVIPPEFIGQRTNWPKCFIEFPTMPATPKKVVVLFDIFFTELEQKTLQEQLGTGFGNKR
jgi:hypothetical protein